MRNITTSKTITSAIVVLTLLLSTFAMQARASVSAATSVESSATVTAGQTAAPTPTTTPALTSTTTAPPLAFSDVETNSAVANASNFLVGVGRFDNYQNGKLNSEAHVTRQQFAHDMNLAMFLTSYPSENAFYDIGKKNKFYYEIDAIKDFISGCGTKSIKVRKKVKVKKSIYRKNVKKFGKKAKKYVYKTFRKKVKMFYPKKYVTTLDALTAVVNLLTYKATETEKSAVTLKQITAKQKNALAIAKRLELIDSNTLAELTKWMKLDKGTMCILFANALDAAPGLKDVFAENFKIGAAVNHGKDDLVGARKAFVLKNFNSITAENHMKVKTILQEDFSLDFTNADKYVEFAEQNSIAIRGHNLLWHESLPDFFLKNTDGTPADKETVKKRIRQYAYDVVTHYKGRIKCWDVVNEVLHLDTQENKYYQLFGNDFSYVEEAFYAAHEADPDCVLFYNDFAIETDLTAFRMTYDRIKAMLDKGVPITGIGLQCHLTNSSCNIGNIEYAITEFSKLGLEVHVTELDISMKSYLKDNYKTTRYQNSLPRAAAYIQARCYANLFKMLKRIKKVTSVTFWNVDDATTWLSKEDDKDYPLLFDKHLLPKPAYWAVIGA